MNTGSGAFQFSLPLLEGGTLDLARFAGRPMLIVNTASQCGFTGQYAGLQRLWKQYGDRGLAVVGVPCNDFGRQEPGTAEEIGAFCQRNYGVTFPLTAKLGVRGAGAHPLFRFLSREGGVLSQPRWNFYKYVIDRHGGLFAWFTSATKPESDRLRRAVEHNLG